MKVVCNPNSLSYRASGNDLRFINSIRDKDVAIIENLQKQKIETLLKYREVKKVIELYQDMFDKYSNSGIAEEIIAKAKKNLEDMKTFRDILYSKLKEINLSILAEEEKNY